MIIQSTHNPKIQKVRALLNRRKERSNQAAFVLEGVRLVEESLKSGWLPELVLVSQRLSERGSQLVERLRQAGVRIDPVDAGVLEKLSDAETSQGILAVAQKRPALLPQGWDFLIVADNLRDPGNLGTILRSAAAAGVQGLILTPGSVDAFAPKVVRAAMGAHFYLPIIEKNWQQISALVKQREPAPARLLVADSSHGKPCWSADLRGPVVLVIGGEAQGAQEEAFKLADEIVHIPMPGKGESLNAAAAAAILLFEVVRQRQP